MAMARRAGRPDRQQAPAVERIAGESDRVARHVGQRPRTPASPPRLMARRRPARTRSLILARSLGCRQGPAWRLCHGPHPRRLHRHARSPSRRRSRPTPRAPRGTRQSCRSLRSTEFPSTFSPKKNHGPLSRPAREREAAWPDVAIPRLSAPSHQFRGRPAVKSSPAYRPNFRLLPGE
jgi:hypothetical protein